MVKQHIYNVKILVRVQIRVRVLYKLINMFKKFKFKDCTNKETTDSQRFFSFIERKYPKSLSKIKNIFLKMSKKDSDNILEYQISYNDRKNPSRILIEIIASNNTSQEVIILMTKYKVTCHIRVDDSTYIKVSHLRYLFYNYLKLF